MNERKLMTFATFAAHVVVGLGLMSFGMAGCIEHNGPWTQEMPNGFHRWEADAQISWVQARKLEKETAIPRQLPEVAQPIYYLPLIVVGIAIAGVGVVYMILEER